MVDDKPIQDVSEQYEEERKLATFIKNKVEESRQSANRVASESIWLTNIAYLVGLSGIKYNSTAKRFLPNNDISSWGRSSKLTSNKLLSYSQTRLAKLCQNSPKFDVRPESNNSDDREAARLGLQVLCTMWEKLSIDKKRLALFMWVQSCGHAWMKISWDDSLGNPMTDPLTGQMKFEGDVWAEVVSPFEVFPDQLAKSDDDIYRSHLTHCKVRSLDYFKTRYPEKGDLVKPEDVWLMSAQYEQRINTMNTRGPSLGGLNADMKNCAVEMVRYESRSEKHPNGRMIVVASGIVLEDKELPCGMIPLARFDDIVIGGKVYPECPVTHARPLQDYYNEILRRRSEWTKRLLAGKYAVARGAGLAQESLDDNSGEVLQYDPVPNAPDGGRPTALNVPDIPPYAYKEEEAIEAQIREIFGISEVSSGNLPSASIPAIGMQLLVEQDATRAGVVTEQHEHAWARVGTLILKYVENYYEVPRKMKMSGRNSQYTVKEVSGKMLKGNTDVMVVRGSTSPTSKVLQRQDIMNTYQSGLLGDPQDPKVREKVLGMIEFGNVSEIWEDYNLDLSQVKKGIEDILSGEIVEISEFDNHAMWLQEMNRFRKSDKWNALDPKLKDYFVGIMEQHIQELMHIGGAPPPPEENPQIQQQAQMAQSQIQDDMAMNEAENQSQGGV